MLVLAVKQLFPEFEFMWLVDEAKKNLPLELDFLNEGRNAEKVAQMLKHFDFLKVGGAGHGARWSGGRGQPWSVHPEGLQNAGGGVTELLGAPDASSRADGQVVPVLGTPLRILNGEVSCSELVFMWLLNISRRGCFHFCCPD